MRTRSFVFLSLAFFVLSQPAVSAEAPASRGSQQAPAFYMLSPNDPTAEKVCKDKGGAVSTDRDGYKVCTMARACAAGGAMKTIKLDTSDPAAAKKCQDACGTVSTGADGAPVCTKPG